MYIFQNKPILPSGQTNFGSQLCSEASMYCYCGNEGINLPVIYTKNILVSAPALLPPTMTNKESLFISKFPSVGIQGLIKTREAGINREEEMVNPFASQTTSTMFPKSLNVVAHGLNSAVTQDLSQGISCTKNPTFKKVLGENSQIEKSESQNEDSDIERAVLGDRDHFDFLKYPKIPPHLSFIKEYAHSVSYDSDKGLNKKRVFHCKFGDCQKSFNKTWNFINHARTHLKIKPYQCQTCHKRFTQRGNMKIHEKIHQRKKKASYFQEAIYSKISKIRISLVRSS
ncbi:unnamed protein product [Moneuplotes crassus]|uniref:C2H2-type domain-containing protein n=1 Tax=Euplotes crassus TaxID=5936 RepID=A0AAD1Y4G6_EUPCR|nr:unnamed protein product [Moneuplotes crassus]